MNKYLKKMVSEMELRGLKERTKSSYLQSMRYLMKYYDKSPELISLEEIKEFLINKKKYNGKQLSANTINRHVVAIRFFYKRILNRTGYEDELPRRRTDKKIPLFFSQLEIKKMIDSLYNIKYKAIFMTIYSTGMRLGEFQNLKVSDIDSKRMVIHIRNGKGGKDRMALLSPNLLAVLRTYWKENKDDKSKYLFAPSKNSYDPTNLSKHLTHTTVKYVLTTAAKAAGIKKKSILTR